MFFFLLFYRILLLTFKRSANIAVMSVIGHSLSRGNRRYISAYIVGSGHFAAASVTSHSAGRII
jgi:hypothetical protein